MNTPFVPSAAPKKHRNLAQAVVAYLSDSIRNGPIHPGEKLPTESEIMRTQGVSRTVVREALSHLQAAGLVETRHGIGTFVLKPPTKLPGFDPGALPVVRDVLAIFELRISLESEAAALAATRRTDADMEHLRTAHEAFALCALQGGDTVRLDVQFHLAIAQASGNPYFHDILSRFGNDMIPISRIDSHRRIHYEPGPFLERVTREHEDISNAIARQDPEAARAAMRTHLSNSRERLRRTQEQIENAGAASVR